MSDLVLVNIIAGLVGYSVSVTILLANEWLRR